MTELPAVMTLAAYARLHRVTKGCVTGWKRRGYLVLVEGGKVDVAESNRRLASRPSVHRGGTAKVRPGKPVEAAANSELYDVSLKAAGVPSDPEGWTMHEARRREMVAGAKLRELQLAREAGKVADIEEVADKVGKRLSIVRSQMLALSPALAPRLAVLDTPEGGVAACSTRLSGRL